MNKLNLPGLLVLEEAVSRGDFGAVKAAAKAVFPRSRAVEIARAEIEATKNHRSTPEGNFSLKWAGFGGSESAPNPHQMRRL